jgi:hypothetical protein
MEHVVTVFGHTRNSDEWHPQAIPAYAGPAGTLYYSSSAWTDHFIINDDNFGPYHSLTARALEVDPNVRADWIIPLCPIKLETTPIDAEVIAAFFTNHILSSLVSTAAGNWLKYMTGNQWTYIFRAILIGKNDYISHLRTIKGHDLSRMTQTEIGHLNILPNELFWMVEFSLPEIYTGNRTKLGEVLLRANIPPDVSNIMKSILAIRLPRYIVTANPAGALSDYQVSLDTHVPLYRVGDHDHQW